DTDGRGIPHNVQIGRTGVDDSRLSFGSSDASRYCTGSIIVGDGLGTGYQFELSSVSGGDLRIDGDFTLNANSQFIPNNRAVFFVGSSHQNITSNASDNEITFDYIVVNKPVGDLRLSNTPATTVNVSGSLGGNVLVLSNGDLDLQGQTFNLGGTSSYLLVQNENRKVKSTTPENFN